MQLFVELSKSRRQRDSSERGFSMVELTVVVLVVLIIAAIALTLRRRPGLKYQDVSAQVSVRRDQRVRLVKLPAEKRP